MSFPPLNNDNDSCHLLQTHYGVQTGSAGHTRSWSFVSPPPERDAISESLSNSFMGRGKPGHAPPSLCLNHSTMLSHEKRGPSLKINPECPGAWQRSAQEAGSLTKGCADEEFTSVLLKATPPPHSSLVHCHAPASAPLKLQPNPLPVVVQLRQTGIF